MHNVLTNLLPPERTRALERAYFFRLGVVALVLATLLVVAAAALLLPTYVYLANSVAAQQQQLATVESNLSAADEKTLSARLTALTNDATTLIALKTAPSPSALVREILLVSRAGVTLSGFTYVPPAPKAPATMTVSGTAATRDALRNYQLALQNTDFVSAVNLPVSVYAKDSDIAFTVTLILAP